MSQKKKILFLVPLPPPVHGAALNNRSLVDSQLINEAFHLCVIPFNFAVETNDIGRFSLYKVLKSIRRAMTIIHKMIVFRPDVVYFNLSLYGFALYRDLCYVFIFKLFNANILYHLRTQSVKSQVRNSGFKKHIFEYIFKNTHVICLSEYLCGDIVDVYQSKPLIVNDGVGELDSYTYGMNKSMAEINNISVDENNNTTHTPQILFLSNFIKTKGVHELINALYILKTKQIKFSAILAGGAIDVSVESLQKMVNDFDLSGEVKILGPTYARDKYELFLAADIFVLPTYFEAFPGVILEAMQFTLPVISTIEGGIPEIVDDGVTGFLVQKQNVQQLADKIEMLIKDAGLRASMGMKGREKFMERYTISILEKNMKNAFDKVLAKAQRKYSN